MRLLDTFEEIEAEVNHRVACMWLVYRIGQIYSSKDKVKIEIWNLYQEDKVLFLPFILNNKSVLVEKDAS